MKKILSLMVSVIAVLSFASCEFIDGLTGSKQEKLKTPVIEIVDITSSGFTVQWEPVQNAESYIVELDGTSYTTKKTSYTFTNLAEDTYTVRVWASASGYEPSDYAQMAVKVANNGGEPGQSKLATPNVSISNVSDTGFTAKWNKITGAETYTVNCNGKSYTTSQTSYDFTNLSAGSYVVKVKASGNGYNDSDYGEASVTISGATTSCWFSQSAQPAEVDESEGYAPYNAIEFTWKGSGVKSLKYGMFYAADAKNASDNDIINALDPVKSEYIEYINSASGYTGIFYNLDPSTEFMLCAYVTFTDGTQELKKSFATTEAAPASSYLEQWCGTWTVKTTKKVYISQDSSASLKNESDTFTVTVSPYSGDANCVIVDGLSVLGSDIPTLGEMEGDRLKIQTGFILEEGDSYDYCWLTYASVNGNLGIICAFDYAYVLTMNADGSVSCAPCQAVDEDGNELEVVANDLFGLDDEGNVRSIDQSFPAVYRAGNMSWTKKSNAYAAQRSLDMANVNHKAIKSALSIR